MSHNLYRDRIAVYLSKHPEEQLYDEIKNRIPDFSTIIDWDKTLMQRYRPNLNAAFSAAFAETLGLYSKTLSQEINDNLSELHRLHCEIPQI